MMKVQRIVQREFTGPDRRRARSRLYVWRNHCNAAPQMNVADLRKILEYMGRDSPRVSSYRDHTTACVTPHFVFDGLVKGENSRNVDLHLYLN